MSFKKNIRALCLIIIVFAGSYSCNTEKAYPDERLVIDSNFLKLFNALIKEDTFSFSNKTGNRKVFVITEIDSIISNKKGSFINERPYKLLIMKFSELGQDTVPLDRENEIFINKYPDNGVNSISIQFNNFHFGKDSVLPQTSHDANSLNNNKVANYYQFKTSLQLKRPDDVQQMYISSSAGIIGFKTLSGEVWSRGDNRN